MLKWSLNVNRPDSAVPVTLARRFFASLSFSTSISAQTRTPVHRLTSATFFWEMTELKNSAWRRDGVGGVRAREEVMISALVTESYVTSRSWAFGGDIKTKMYEVES